MFVRRYKDELRIYSSDIEYVKDRVPTLYEIEHNIVLFANAIILFAIERFDNDFIDDRDFNTAYDKIIAYVDNIDLLGARKVFTKITQEIIVDVLHMDPFMVYM